MKNVLLLKTGEAALSVRLTVGDYDTWFHRSVVGAGCRLKVLRPSLGEPLPRHTRGWDAVWTTGSPASVTDWAPWMQQTADFLLETARQQIPVLGVCFGHQLLARAYGGNVGRSSRGREIGTVDVTLTPEGRADPLFDGMPERVQFQATHEDLVSTAPPGATVLAGNDHTQVQSFAVGDHVRAVQFHPEADAAAMRALIDARAEQLNTEGAQQGEPGAQRVTRLLAGVAPTPHGQRLLRNFLRHWT